MLLRNIDKSLGLCNGTRLIVARLCKHVIETTIISGKFAGERVIIARMMISPSDSRGREVVLLLLRNNMMQSCYSNKEIVEVHAKQGGGDGFVSSETFMYNLLDDGLGGRSRSGIEAGA
ncbi:ATP-dependent DNA helicase PIF1-like [Senna tora]|uniref:ATP-dependent DNA helicase PIF1-like n=1 Tax=Senna tora TaxID=362788 RepID=A0A834SP82_9FABA|nr:ATP-dependent DNA helicase PIF1-like [Senna tora]